MSSNITFLKMYGPILVLVQQICAKPFRKMHEIAEHVMILARMWTTLLIHTFDTYKLQFPILTSMMLSMLGIACSCLQAHLSASKSPKSNNHIMI